MSLLNEHIIVEAYAARAFFQLRKLPTKGNLLLNGTIMRVGDRFTQEDVGSGALQYQNTVVDLKAEIMKDNFKYVIPLSETEILTSKTPRSTCLPGASIPEDGEFTFGITILCIPYPKEIYNRHLVIMEDETYCLNRRDLFYSSDSNEIKRFDENPAIYAPNLENQNFNAWKRFSGQKIFERGQTIPTSDVASHWIFDPEVGGSRGMLLTKNSPEISGAVSYTTADRFSFESTMSSTAKDDDLIFMIAAYDEVNGNPYFIGAGRSGGLNSNGGNLGHPSWFLFTSTGTGWTMLVDGSARAPNHNNNLSNEAWPSLGTTRVEVVRKGNTITARCSQFGSDEYDDSTTLTYTIPSGSPWANRAQYGFGALSQNNARLVDLNFKILPPDGEEPEDPRDNPLFERFPITYTVTTVDQGPPTFQKLNFKLNGNQMVAGDTFSHLDIDDGLICIEGQNIGSYKNASIIFNACANVNKCTQGRLFVDVREWPYPVVENHTAAMDECAEITLTEDNLYSSVEFGSTPAQVTYTFNLEETLKRTPLNHIEVVPAVFTQADIAAGLVKLVHHCAADKTPTTELLVFNVCTQKNKCSIAVLDVKVKLKPVEFPPADPDTNVIPLTGCTYTLGFDGQWQLVGKCGIYSEVSGRDIPEPKEEGEIIYVPNAEVPVTLVTVREGDKLVWRTSPVMVSFPPEGECLEYTDIPNIKSNVNVIYAQIIGQEYDGVPEFALIVDNKRYEVKKFDGLESGQQGVKRFVFTYEGTLGANTTIGIVQTNYKINGDKRRYIKVNKLTINGSDIYDYMYYNASNNKITNPPWDYGEITGNYFSVRVKQPAKGWDIAPPTGDPRVCYKTPDGTFVSDGVGQLAPVKGTWTGKVDPISKDYDFLPAVESMKDPLPPGKFVFDKETQNVWVKQPDETYIPEPNPYSQAYTIDPFSWIGPNEFWLPFGKAFTVDFWCNRLYTRIDILRDNGTQLYTQYDNFLLPSRTDKTSWLLTFPGHSSVDWDPNNTNYSYSIRNIMQLGLWSNRFSDMVQSALNEQYPLANKSYNTDPHAYGAYLVRFGGSDYYAGFAAGTRPVNSPQIAGRNEPYIPFSAQRYNWIEGRARAYGAGGLERNVPINALADSLVYPKNGSQYGWLDIKRHMDGWKSNDTNYDRNPVTREIIYEKRKAFHQGKLTMLSPEMVNNSREKRNGGPVNTLPPTVPTTLSFVARAYDIYSGEQVVRTFKIHYSATGRSPDGAVSKITDAPKVTGGTAILPPRGGTMICVYKDSITHTFGDCTIMPPATPDPTSPPKTPRPW